MRPASMRAFWRLAAFSIVPTNSERFPRRLIGGMRPQIRPHTAQSQDSKGRPTFVARILFNKEAQLQAEGDQGSDLKSSLDLSGWK